MSENSEIKTISVLALSSGEAELMSIVKASTEALGLQAIYRDFGLELSLAVRSDATAAIGMVARVGLGRVRHLAVSDLWVQSKDKDGTIKHGKVPGAENTSDMMTKPVDEATLNKHLKSIGVVVLAGRPDAAPKAEVHDK